jgi:hypothetical protein
MRQNGAKQNKRKFALNGGWQRDLIEFLMFIKYPRLAFQDRRLQPLGYSSAILDSGRNYTGSGAICSL